MKHSPEYRALISSPAWKRRRQAMISKAGFRCARCGGAMCGFQFFELHHKTYERLGRERDDDLEVLCKPCHERADEQRCAKALYDARLNGWATKVYGDDWEWNEDKSEVEQDFDDWLQGHDDEY